MSMNAVATSGRAERRARAADTPRAVLDACARIVDSVVEQYGASRGRFGLQDDSVNPSIAWVVNHATYLRTTIRETREMISARYYRALPADPGARVPRIRALARDFVGRHGEQVDERAVVSFFEEAQSARSLTLAELWAMAPMLRLALFEKLRSHAEGWKLKGPKADGRRLESEGLTSDGSDGASTHEYVAGETETPGLGEATGEDDRLGESNGAIIMALHALDDMQWRELTESLCALDKVLDRDPAGVYPRMDFETRDSCRRAVERIARRSVFTEEQVAELALDLADEAAANLSGVCTTHPAGAGFDEPAGPDGPATEFGDRARHVGHYLIGKGAPLLEQNAGYRTPLRARLSKLVRRAHGVFHLGSAAVMTALLMLGLAHWLAPAPWWYVAVLLPLASEAALAIVNGATHLVTAPTRLPRMDFSEGIADDCRTLVVTPSLLFSAATIDDLVTRLEINYLANRDRNVRFALITNAADSAARTDDDEELGQACAARIRDLNGKYGGANGPFYLFHRARTWSAAEGVWMGHERKRGKLNAVNAWLTGGPDAFMIKEGNLDALAGVRYVITLDSDTRMPVDAARALVGTAAHPLNRPVFDPRTGIVRDGYAIFQPRVSVSLESARQSRLAQLHCGTIGIDPYTTAVSDVYQDVYGRATFTGKGLYDLAAFHRTVDGRFPDNALLSHDLIEGEHARVGLVSDVEFIDDYPRNYEVYSKRKHRWTRGDWQLVPWLLRTVPHQVRAWTRNPLSLLSRWKILDNLRRSTLEMSAVLAVVMGWVLAPDRTPRVAAALVGLLVAGAWADGVSSLLRLPPRRVLRSFAREKLVALARAHLDAVLSLGLALHQALLMADAIGRTLVRRLITKRHLLQWETSAQAESMSGGKRSLVNEYLNASPVFVVALVVLAPAVLRDVASLVIAAAWMAAPVVARWLSRAPSGTFRWSASDATFLRGVALRTWRYFDEWTDAGHHWLAPDTVQESPACVARQTSPTNIGLQLAATVAARDFGYLTVAEMATACSRVLDTVGRMERFRGHLYNWYDTATLTALAPKYVSTVDSGNLCGALIAVRQACLDVRTQPVAGGEFVTGLHDHLVRVRNSLPRGLRRRAIARAITAMLHRLDTTPPDAFSWACLLAELRPQAVAVNEWLQFADSRRRWQRPSDSAEAAAWAQRLIERIDEVGRHLRRYAPWVDWPDRNELPQPVVDALGRLPALSASAAHYDEIERTVRAFGAAPSSVATARSEGHTAGGEVARPVDGSTLSWQRVARLRRQIAAARAAAAETDGMLCDIADRCGRLAMETDFAFLFDERRKLLSIGYNADAGDLDTSSYDLLASEARMAVLMAIAKRDIPSKAWFHLGRKLASVTRDRVLVSWGGTMFEHAMPTLFMRNYDGTLLDASARAMVRVQQAWAREQGAPWGFSEAAHADQDAAGRYAYRTFGVPAVAMRRMSPDELVVAPYASVLALMIDPAAALENLRLMAAKGWIGRYGLYESIDYRAGEAGGTRTMPGRRRATVVRSFMVHHHGMSLVALANALLGNRMQQRFHAEPMVAAVERLLQERLPSRLPAEQLDTDAPFEPIPLTSREAAHIAADGRPADEANSWLADLPAAGAMRSAWRALSPRSRRRARRKPRRLVVRQA